MALALIQVNVPNVVRHLDEEMEGGETVIRKYGDIVRGLIQQSPEQVEYVSEIPYLNGTKPWIEFSFTCDMNFVEECLRELENSGIGGGPGRMGSRKNQVKSVGMITVLPATLQRLASRPAIIGSPIRPTMVQNAASLAASMHSIGGDNASLTDLDECHPTVTEVIENNDESSVSHANGSGRNHPIGGCEENGNVLDFKKFNRTVRSKVAVESVVNLINSSAQFSFDYVMLLVCAAILACIGLVSNNTVVIVASMLVSPLMGPILAVTFGVVLRDWKMVKVGLFSELMGLFICFVIGFIGTFFAAVDEDRIFASTWPTEEMYVRTIRRSFVISIVVAFVSGIAGALSVLGNNTSSLVGVAISASLLPPAVNSGVLIAMNILLLTTDRVDSTEATQNANNLGYNRTTDFQGDFFGNELWRGAILSLGITLVNIACVWIAAIGIFKIKEVIPSRKSKFWTTHVPNVRHYNKMIGSKSFDDATKDDLRKYFDRQLSERRLLHKPPVYKSLSNLHGPQDDGDDHGDIPDLEDQVLDEEGYTSLQVFNKNG